MSGRTRASQPAILPMAFPQTPHEDPHGRAIRSDAGCGHCSSSTGDHPAQPAPAHRSAPSWPRPQRRHMARRTTQGKSRRDAKR